MKFLTKFLWKLGWQLHKMCPNSPLAPKKKDKCWTFRGFFYCVWKKLTCSEHPGLWRIFGITHIISKCAFISSRHKEKKLIRNQKKKRFFAKNHFLTCMIFFTVTYFNGFLTIKIVSNQKKIKLHKRFCYFSFGGLWRNVY